ncbi:MAG TPA: twin-arginine translocation pathway signal [Pseudolabrys sp.]|jgi:hypothetical protein
MPNSLASGEAMTCDGTLRKFVGALVALALSGCMSDETASRLLAAPDRYILYSCPELVTAAQANAARQRELEALIAKAGTGAGGQVASNMAYRPEYAQLRGQMDQIRKTAADRNCKPAPGATGPGGRSSERVVR